MAQLLHLWFASEKWDWFILWSSAFSCVIKLVISSPTCRPFTKVVSWIIRCASKAPNLKWNRSSKHLDENEVEFQHLVRANETSEWLWKLYVKYVAVAIGGVLTMSLFSVLHCYLTQGNFNTELYYRPLYFAYGIEMEKFSFWSLVIYFVSFQFTVEPNDEFGIFSWTDFLHFGCLWILLAQLDATAALHFAVLQS